MTDPGPQVTEIAPDIYRISGFVPEFGLQFNHFLVKDEEPLLFHTGLKAMFPLVLEGVRQVIDPAELRWISFSHLEADECGALPEWLEVAGRATPVCSALGALVNRDFTGDVREARGMQDGEVLSTGNHRFRFLRTAQLPHGWDAGLLYEEATATLLCSDLFHQNGACEPVTESDIVERARASLTEYEAGILADYVPYSGRTDRAMRRLAELKPRTLAAMHGSTFVGDGEQALLDLNEVLREIFGEPELRTPAR
jgi:flavorubredoxin